MGVAETLPPSGFTRKEPDSQRRHGPAPYAGRQIRRPGERGRDDPEALGRGAVQKTRHTEVSLLYRLGLFSRDHSIIQCQAADSRRLVFSPLAFGSELKKLERECRLRCSV